MKKPQSVKNYPQPSYPTRLKVLAEPSLLEKHVPRSWLACGEIRGALALFLATNSLVFAADKPIMLKPDAPAKVAPIFEHGDGSGAMGCVVVTMPIFLSEEEALVIISTELSKQGLTFSTHVPVESAMISKMVTRERQFFDEVRQEEVDLPATGRPLIADLADSKHQVVVEYVSEDDYFTYGGERSESTVQGYNIKRIAGRVRDKVALKGKGIYAGIFYDPVVEMDFELNDSEKELTATSKRLLRQQVRDFIAWLEAQGAM